LKYKLIKALDLAGLNVFEPVVKLAYMDEPQIQIKKIFYFIIIPILAFVAFLLTWNYVAPRHTTKSGEVPTPPVVLSAWDGIITFHERENQKMADFQLTGEAREQALKDVEARLAELKPAIEASNKVLAEAQAEQKKLMDEKLAPIVAEYDAKKAEFRQSKKDRGTALKEMATQLAADDKEGKLALLESIKEDTLKSTEERNILNALKDQMNEARSFVLPAAKKAQTENSKLMAEQQYKRKRLELLSSDNRSMKVSAAQKDLEETKDEFLNASGTSLLSKGKSVVRREQSIERVEGSNYAKPWTFLDQIWRSIACVFVGFGIAILIAIPIGILCGLSKIFMAAMVPLISLFKPVSPIVWLPIVFIIVGGFIDDPETSAVHPAFLSSAITVALCSLWPTLVNTALGVASIEKDYLNVAKVLKLGFWSRLFKIVIPSALPLMFTGLRISLGVGWMVLVAAELLSSSEGIGKFVWDMFNNGSSETFAQMFVVVFIVGVVGLILDRIMIILQRAVSFEAAASGL
jgi:nitrate/nitrite transport system permease protein